MGSNESEHAVRWETTERGFRHYALAEGNVVYESSAASSPHLWINGEHYTVEEAGAMRDALPPGAWRDTLTAAIDGHYQTRDANPEVWKAGDPCELCGSTDTALTNDVASCNACGADEGSG